MPMTPEQVRWFAQMFGDIATNVERVIIGKTEAIRLAVARESEQQNAQFKTEDFKEGVAAMAARREPNFQGR